MNFQFTEEQLMIQQAARDFAQNELLPGVIERDEHQKFPAEQIKKMGELGFMGIMVEYSKMECSGLICNPRLLRLQFDNKLNSMPI